MEYSAFGIILVEGWKVESSTAHWTLIPLDLLCRKKAFDLTASLYNAIVLHLLINSFVPNPPFLYPLKTSENRKVFWCFQGVEKGCIENKWVKRLALADLILASLIWYFPNPWTENCDTFQTNLWNNIIGKVSLLQKKGYAAVALIEDNKLRKVSREWNCNRWFPQRNIYLL